MQMPSSIRRRIGIRAVALLSTIREIAESRDEGRNIFS